MRVLWFSCTPSMYDEKIYGGWVASLEKIVKKYCRDIELGIAFEHTDKCFKCVNNKVTYYPICRKKLVKNKLKALLSHDAVWKILKPMTEKVVEDFQPDLIQCFGSEWPFGYIAALTNVPVVIHMQGFLNVYSLSGSIVLRTFDVYKYYYYNPINIIRYWYRGVKDRTLPEREKKIMAMNHYFMGRTEWDKNMVRYFSPNSVYYYCPEAIRSEIKDSTKCWQYTHRKKMIIVTISSASVLKGNDLILRTAKILKEMHFDFEWRVAGSKDAFCLFENILGLKHEDLNITLLGHIKANLIVDELSQADVYVHTAIIDNSPNSLCEAQLIGCPVISTNVGGIPQLVENGVTGILFPYNEPHTLAFNLMNMYGDKEKLEFLSKNEKRIAHNRHDEKSLAERLMEIYKDVLVKNSKA